MLSDRADCEGVRGQLGSEDYPDGFGNHVGFTLRPGPTGQDLRK